MPPILNAQSLSKRFGAKTLFEDLSFTVNDGDRIGLIGPNGAGKSTLLAVLAGHEDTDSGEVAARKRARVAFVVQNSEFAPGVTIRQVLERALGGSLVPADEHEQRLRETAGRAGFADVSVEAASLSGGWRKRLAICEAAITEPDVLLLDEPTNHLDLQGIAWLEEMLEDSAFAAVIVSHDRYFLERVANVTVELNRIYAGGLLRVNGSYSRFLEEREEQLAAQQKAHESLRNAVKTEIEWLRRGPKARTTKSKARIDKAHEMIADLSERNSRSVTKTAGIDFAATDRQTKRLVEMEQVSCELGGRTILREVDLLLTNGMRLGLVGPNGSGKTTLLRLLTGELEPTSGTVKRANMLRLVYFSQMREIDPALTLRRALAPEGDSVVHNGSVVHVASWAARFLFTGEQLNQPIERLSGGERARVLIARLMLQPADVLLMDEPTNDLDIPTLEILEQNLLEYPGALVLVTHDRYMLDRVSTTVLALDGRGNSQRFADYPQSEQWMRTQMAEEPSSPATAAATPAIAEAKPAVQAVASKKKLSYLEQREWDGIEARIAEADERLSRASAALVDPAIASDASRLQQAITEEQAAREAADVLMERWAELAEKVG
ncbi:MAG: ABC-F family ATP-binding cassette domain-containing protein [Terriglobus roseus]|nr:ABC-F family ATP-binding cassette domain-containing protein [Terriglobus roseus]